MEKTVEQIKNEMEANSKAWHTADSETRKTLEETNQELGKQIGGVYDAAAGKWSDSNGNPLFGNSNTNTNGGVDINGVDAAYKAMQDNLNAGTAAMMKLQQDHTDFEVKKIEQQKEQTKKDFEKEQTAAYTDYQKQINPYAANAEQLATQGMSGTGYAESSKVRMYSDYQNRVAVARQSYTQAITAYDNAMTEARLQNSAVLAQLAFDTLEKTLELATQGLIYKNELLMERENILYQRNWAEEDRDYNRGRDIIEDEHWQKDYELRQKEADNATYTFSDGLNISTEFYDGAINEDAYNGVFKTTDNNGISYQPNNINGVLLKPAGFTTCVTSENLDGKKRITKQNVWKLTSDDSLWVWNGAENRYVPYTGGENAIPKQDTIVSTPYYNGPVNRDVRHGTFKTTDVNGARYQPNNVDGDYLEWTGDYYEFDVEQKYGNDRKKKETVQVKIWKTKNGKKKYYWNGNENKYIPFEESEESVPGIRVTNNSSGNTSDPTYWDYSKYSFK